MKPQTRQPARATLMVAALALSLTTAACSSTTSSQPDTGDSLKTDVIPAEDGPGVTDDTITLSWGRSSVPDEVPAEVKKQLRAARDATVEAFNSQGGVAGRDVVLLEDDPGEALTQQREEAYTKSNYLPVPDPTNGRAVCDAYQDADVFALLFSSLVESPLGTPAAGACLNTEGRPVIGVRQWATDDYAAAPATAGLSIASDRFVDALVAAGQDSGAFDENVKTAVITDSSQPEEAFGETELAVLAEAGVVDADVIPVSPTATQAEALNLVVKLKGAGYERVILGIPDAMGLSLTLVPVFDQQKYYPAFISVDGISYSSLVLGAQIAFTPQLEDSLISYRSTPLTDVLKPTDAQLSTAAGQIYQQVVTDNPQLAPYIDLDLCDALALLQASLEASGSDYVNAEAFAQGLGELTDFQSIKLLATSFGPDQHDGGAGIVRLNYSDACKCDEVADTVVPF